MQNHLRDYAFVALVAIIVVGIGVGGYTLTRIKNSCQNQLLAIPASNAPRQNSDFVKNILVATSTLSDLASKSGYQSRFFAYDNTSSVVELSMKDPMGNIAGYYNENKIATTSLHEIPGSMYYREDPLVNEETASTIGDPTKILLLDDPIPGNYILTITGISSGVFDVEIDYQNRSGHIDEMILKGVARAGSNYPVQLGFDGDTFYQSWPPPQLPDNIALPGDLNLDGVVDNKDVQLLLPYINTPTEGYNDPRELKDGLIDNQDLEALRRLCNKPNCATP